MSVNDDTTSALEELDQELTQQTATSWAIHEGDCIDVMRTLPAESVDAVFTSPPYAMHPRPVQRECVHRSRSHSKWLELCWHRSAVRVR